MSVFGDAMPAADTRDGADVRAGRRVWLALAAIIVLAVTVRFAGIGSHLSIDDAYSWLVASSPSAHVFLARLADNENTPPLFYLLLMAMPSFAPAWLRIPAAVPGVLLCGATYLVLRPRLGQRASLLAALGVAVAPFLITYSNLARGFMLADLALLVALGALLSLCERETSARWLTFVCAGVVAVWAEYGSAIFVIALVLASVWIGKPRRRAALLAGALILVTLAPWIPEIVRGQNQVGVTKFGPQSATPSLTALRDVVVTLALGENGGTTSSAGRWLELLVTLGFAIVGVVVLRRGWDHRDPRARVTIQMLGATAALTLIGYALAAVVGIDVFTQRYLTILVPVGAGLGAAVVVAFDQRAVTLAAAAALVVLGLVGVATRFDGEWEPNLAPIRAAAVAMHPRTVLTNTPVVLYYLSSFRPLFDRPYNIGPGRSATCPRPCLAIDDARVSGGTPRPMTGIQHLIVPYLLTLER